MKAKNVLITVLSVMLVSVSALCIYLGVELKNEKRHKANHETVESVVYDTVCVEKCSIKPVKYMKPMRFACTTHWYCIGTFQNMFIAIHS